MGGDRKVAESQEQIGRGLDIAPEEGRSGETPIHVSAGKSAVAFQTPHSTVVMRGLSCKGPMSEETRQRV